MYLALLKLAYEKHFVRQLFQNKKILYNKYILLIKKAAQWQPFFIPVRVYVNKNLFQ